MAIADYKCTKCNVIVEDVDIAPIVKCVMCNEQMIRIWSVPNVHSGCLNASNVCNK